MPASWKRRQPDPLLAYAGTRSATERVSDFLKEKGYAAGHYHAGPKPEAKLETQKQFVNGMLRVIAATNAFGIPRRSTWTSRGG